MSNEQATRLHTIGQVVARLQDLYPDVTPSSLRFLEREGLVEPERTSGGHRLYSDAHVDRVRRIKAWQQERLSLAEIRDRLEAAKAMPGHKELGERFLGYAIQGDASGARDAILAAYQAGMPLVEIYDEVLRPVLYDIGKEWEAGRLTVGQEHEISAMVRDLIGELAAGSPRPTKPAEVYLAACVTGETHDLGLRMVSHLLQSEGYAVHFLGANVPPDSILDGVRMRNATVVLLSVTLEESISQLIETLKLLNTLPEGQRPRTIVGGQVLAKHEAELAKLGAETVNRLTIGNARGT